ncbi:MAG: heavy-metal-associated domain-containing protein [Oscillospiraceae bacterium]|nr:heavy-metal-associated domain-containing protein [Oscillospiraceae bacterium]
MEETLKISYLNCDFCTAKNHCAACGGELAESLVRRPGIESAEVNIPDRTLRVRHSLGADELEDLLDGMGLLMG